MTWAEWKLFAVIAAILYFRWLWHFRKYN